MDLQQDHIEVTITPAYPTEASLATQPISKLSLSQFQYLAQGSYRVVFRTLKQDSAWFGKVLMLPKRETQSTIDQQLNEHYLKQLAGTDLRNFMYSKHQYILAQPAQDLLKIEQFVTKTAKRVACDFKHLSNIEIILAEDVFGRKQEYDLVLEAKTKTIVPDLYADFALRQIAKQRNISYEQIKQALSNCDSTEKTKWFKSKIGHNKREYENSFGFYGLSQLINTNFEFKPLSRKNIKFNSQKYSEEVLTDMFCQELMKSNILTTIHSILTKVNMPRQIGLFPDLQMIPQLPKLPVKLPLLLSNLKIGQATFKESLNELESESCVREYDGWNKQTAKQTKRWQNLYKYLIFMCISDMSIVGKIKLAHHAQSIVVEKSQFKILDFELIPLKSVKRRHTKNQSVLTRWLDYRQIGCYFDCASSQFNKQMLIIKHEHQIPFLSQANKSLKISSQIQIGDQKIRQIIKNSLKLQQLDLCLNKQVKLWLTELSKQHLTHLKLLNLDSTHLSYQNLQQLSLYEFPQLEILKLNYNGIGDSVIKLVKQSNWPKLNYIELNWNQISCEGIKNIKRWAHLRRISLVQNHIRDEGIKELCWQGNMLEHINLWENKLTILGIEHLSTFKFHQLRRLILGGNHINDEGFALICQAPWPSIAYIDLCVNEIKLQFDKTKINQKQIANTFKLNQLSVLKLGTNSIKSTGVKNFTNLIKLCQQLEVLDLYFNEIGDEGLLNLCRSSWPKLRALDLSMCQISDKLIGAIQSSKFQQLRHLQLVRNNLTELGLKSILNQKQWALEHIDLMGNRISKKELEFIQQNSQVQGLNPKITIRLD